MSDRSATPDLYTLSLHDALPISLVKEGVAHVIASDIHGPHLERVSLAGGVAAARELAGRRRSEEHTSELQSQSKIVCRLLLEKKKYHRPEDHVWPGDRPRTAC